MRTLAHFGIAAPVIEPDVPLHTHVCVKADLCQGRHRNSLVGESEKRSPETASLAARHDCYTVNKQVVRISLKHE